MKKRTLRALLRYGITLAVGLCVSVPVALYQGFAWGQPFQLNARYLSDGCFVAAVLLVGVGGLGCISCTGFFDIFSYAMKSLLTLFTPLRRPRDQISFYDYKLLRAEKRGASPRFILAVGAFFLGLSALLLWAYYGG